MRTELKATQNVIRGLAGSHTARTFAVSLAVLVLGLLGAILLARLLGPSGRGELAAVLLWPTLLTYLASVGQKEAVVYFASLPDQPRAAVARAAMRLVLPQALAAWILGWYALPVLLSAQSPAVVAVSRAYLAVVPVSLAALYGASLLQAQRAFDAYNGLRLIIPAGYLVFIVACAAYGALTVPGLASAQFVLNLLALVATMLVLHRSGVLRGLRPRSAGHGLTRRMLGYGIKVQAGDLSQITNARLDQILIALWLPPASLGLYVAAVSAAGVASIIGTSLRVVLVPRVAAKEEAGERVALIRRAFRQYLTLGSCVALAGVLGFPYLVPLVFGPEFAASSPIAVTLLVANLLMGGKVVLGAGGQALGDPWMASQAEIGASGLTLVAMPLVLPTFGIAGAAWVAVGGAALQLSLVMLRLLSKHGIGPLALIRAS